MCWQRIRRQVCSLWRTGASLLDVAARAIPRRRLRRAGRLPLGQSLHNVAQEVSRQARALWQALVRGASSLWAWLRARTAGLSLPLVQRYTDWLQRQQSPVQALVIAWMVGMATALAVLAAFFWINPPTIAKSAPPEAPIQTRDLSEVLYRWLDEQPTPPRVDSCDSFETPARCQRRLALETEEFQDDFRDYVHQQAQMMQSAVWVKAGDAFPKYDATAGEFEFSFRMEGTPVGDEKTCIPLRVIASMPEGIITGAWPDQQGPDSPTNPFPHPCLRCTEWKARVRVDAAEARRWVRAAQADGWRLEMHFRLKDWESPIGDNWDRDACLKANDFVSERRIWLWVDEVRLMVGDEMVRRWQ